MIEELRHYHPLVIEGMGGYDPRDPGVVAPLIVAQLQNHWRRQKPSKPVLLMTQGDPYEARGISAITRLVADALCVSRGLIFLDPDIAAYHAPNADRYKVSLEIPYSALADLLAARQIKAGGAPALVQIEARIEAHLAEKNARRAAAAKPCLPDYYPAFARLQEVTKTACKQICNGITIAHTSREISDSSVSSFYQVGLELGLIAPADMVPFDG